MGDHRLCKTHVEAHGWPASQTWGGSGHNSNQVLLCCGDCSAEDAADTCEANTCTCANGVAKTGAECTTDGASMCASCSTGYTINDAATACTANTCTCANGVAKTG